MRKSLVNRCIITLLTGIILGNQSASAQQDHYSWRIGGSIGYMDYYGDVSPYYIGHWSDWEKAFHLFQYNTHYIPQASYGISVEHKLTRTTGLLFQLDHGKFAMSDRYRHANGQKDPDALHWSRALNFETSVFDLGTALRFQSDNGRLLPENALLAPYLYLGAGLTRFKVKGDLYDKNGDPYQYDNPAVKPDGLYETELRPLLTETAKEYPDLTGYANIGLGLKFRLTDRIDLSVETDLRYAFTDYLDDVHGKYKTAYTSPEEAYAAHPGTNIIDPATRRRGNDDGVNDILAFNKVMFQYNFGSGPKPRFSAPVVYEPGVLFASSPLDSLPMRGDTTHQAGLISADSSDSTSGISKNRDNQIEHELAEIKNELRSSRFTQIDQNYLIREYEVQAKINTIRIQRSALSRPNLSRVDSEQISQYDSRIDSLQDYLSAIRQARDQLRRDVAYSPIVTEYDDSTKIMIYKDRAGRQDRAFIPLIGAMRPDYPGDSAFTKVAGKHPARTYSSAESRRPELLFSGKAGIASSWDSLRYQLDTLIRHAEENGDSASVEQLYELRQRVDSLESRSGEDSAYLLKRIENRPGALSSTDSSEESDSLTPVFVPEPRNRVQRFFDRFKREEQPGPEAYQVRINPDSLSSPKATPFSPAKMPSSDDTLSDEVAKDEVAKELSDNSDQIASLKEEIARLRQEDEAQDRNGKQTIYMTDRDPRQARRDRKALYALGRSLERSNRDNHNPPSISPHIIIKGQPSPDRGSFHHMQAGQDSIKSREVQQNASEIARLQSQLDSLRQQARDKALIDSARTAIHPLQSRVDSLTAQWSRMQQSLPDTPRPQPSGNAGFMLKNYPVVSMYFATGSTHLNSQELEKLRPVAGMAKKYPGTHLFIQGHTDGTGSRAINKIIAEKRCRTVKEALTDTFQIPDDRLLIEPVNPSHHAGSNPFQRRVDVQLR